MDAIQKLQTERQVIRLGQPPLQVDLVTTLEGCDWDAARARAKLVPFGDTELPVIGLEDLKASKRAIGRHRDLDDLENLPDS